MRYFLGFFILLLTPLTAQADVCFQWAIISFPSSQQVTGETTPSKDGENSESLEPLEVHYVREARMVASCKRVNIEELLELEEGQQIIESGCECLDE